MAAQKVKNAYYPHLGSSKGRPPQRKGLFTIYSNASSDAGSEISSVDISDTSSVKSSEYTNLYDTSRESYVSSVKSSEYNSTVGSLQRSYDERVSTRDEDSLVSNLSPRAYKSKSLGLSIGSTESDDSPWLDSSDDSSSSDTFDTDTTAESEVVVPARLTTAYARSRRSELIEESTDREWGISSKPIDLTDLEMGNKPKGSPSSPVHKLRTKANKGRRNTTVGNQQADKDRCSKRTTVNCQYTNKGLYHSEGATTSDFKQTDKGKHKTLSPLDSQQADKGGHGKCDKTVSTKQADKVKHSSQEHMDSRQSVNGRYTRHAKNVSRVDSTPMVSRQANNERDGTTHAVKYPAIKSQRDAPAGNRHAQLIGVDYILKMDVASTDKGISIVQPIGKYEASDAFQRVIPVHIPVESSSDGDDVSSMGALSTKMSRFYTKSHAEWIRAKGTEPALSVKRVATVEIEEERKEQWYRGDRSDLEVFFIILITVSIVILIVLLAIILLK
jgi:hypothetical protein